MRFLIGCLSWVWVLVLMLGGVGCQVVAPGEAQESAATATARGRVQVTRSRTGVVVSDSPVASQIGADILGAGGNAVDAAVATAFALAVAWPEAGNLGGGGFMLITPPPEVRPPASGSKAAPGSPQAAGDPGHRVPVCIDYRETAPGAATIDMYTPGEDRHHARHVGVPGSVAGLAQAHRRYGRLPWRDVVMPAVDLARDGVEVDAHLAGSINRVMGRLEGDDPVQVAELRRVYGKSNGGDWKPGDVLVLPDLAHTLQVVADGQEDAFYTGPLAQRFAMQMSKAGGIITAEDLAGYRAKLRAPTHARFRGHDVYGMPPPSSGGVCVAQMLQVLEPFDLRSQPRGSVRNRHLMAEAMRRAFHQRALRLGDSDFVDVPTAALTRPAFAARLGETIDLARATPSESLLPAIPLTEESPSTTHFSVVDAEGMAVSNTTTLEQSWGSRVVLPGLGFVLNNEMGDFNWTPGRTTRSGAIGTAANVIVPGKRMLSSMSPTIVMRGGEVVLVTGSPGGRTIINTVLGIVLNVVEFEMSVEEAVQAPRMHHSWLPDVLKIETVGPPEPYAALVAELEAMGHTVELRGGSQGSAHTIGFDRATGEAIGVADYRRGGAAVAPQ